MNNRRLIYFSIAVLVVIGIVTLAIQEVSSSGSGKLRLSLIPANAALTIDGQAAQAGTISLKAGSHKIAASLKGYTAESVTVTIKAKQTTTQELTLAATPQTQFQDQQGEAAAGQQAQIQGQAIEAANPILNQLPYGDTGFQIDFGPSTNPSTPNAIILYITYAGDAGKTAALNWITSQGYNPANYQIVYQNAQ